MNCYMNPFGVHETKTTGLKQKHTSAAFKKEALLLVCDREGETSSLPSSLSENRHFLLYDKERDGAQRISSFCTRKPENTSLSRVCLGVLRSLQIQKHSRAEGRGQMFQGVQERAV